jgi:hypothetical protein
MGGGAAARHAAGEMHEKRILVIPAWPVRTADDPAAGRPKSVGPSSRRSLRRDFYFPMPGSSRSVRRSADWRA